ncbi:DUF1501 domain-containing protein [Naumannella sp. ID2617S]|nr:DUF1501 domain-containing protein [Naumannella sp. ID2617S]
MNRRVHDPRNDILLHEDLIVPMHHHDSRMDFLLAQTPDGVKPVDVDTAAELVRKRRYPEVTEVDHVADGPKGLSRRAVLAGGGIGLGALLMPSAQPRYSFAVGTGKQDLLVVIFLRGGMDGLSAVVPVNDPNYYTARRETAVPAGNTFQLNNQFGMNNDLLALKPIWDARQMAIVVGAGNPTLTRSHFEDQKVCEQGNAPANLRSGWVARHLASNSAPHGTFRAVSMGTHVSISLTTTAFDVVALSEIKEFDIKGGPDVRPRMMGSLSAMYRNARGVAEQESRLLMRAIEQLGPERAKEDDGKVYVPANGAVYPTVSDDRNVKPGDAMFGRGMRDIARLARAGVGLECATIDLDEWDMHVKMGETSAWEPLGWWRRKARILAQGIAALRTDLGPLWNSTTVVVMSEFGRRVAANGALGTDHGHGNALFVLGGGINGGIYGTQPLLTRDNMAPAMGEDVPITTDYRQVLNEVVTKRLLNSNTAQVFPGWTAQPPLGLAKPIP